MTTNKNELFTMRQAAELAGYSVTYLRELARRGKIKSLQPNAGKRLIAKDALDDFLNGGK